MLYIIYFFFTNIRCQVVEIRIRMYYMYMYINEPHYISINQSIRSSTINIIFIKCNFEIRYDK